MSVEEAFLREILENPRDETPRLIYADWLEERGDPHAAVARRASGAYRFLARVGNADNTGTLLSRIEALASQGEAEPLGELGQVLAAHRRHALLIAPRRPGDVEAALQHVICVLALTPGLASVRALMRLLAVLRPEEGLLRETASRLASAQPFDTLGQAFELFVDEAALRPLLACLMHETILRHGSLDTPATRRLHEALAAEGHPLAWLPRDRSWLEGRAHEALPHYTYRSHGWSSSFSWQDLAVGAEAPHRAISAHDVTTPEARALLTAPVRGWQTFSNGVVEARVLALSEQVRAEDVGVSILASLDLEALRGGEDNLRAGRIPPEQGFQMLFAAGSGGGAYGGRLDGAFGRLAAWQAVAGLVGLNAASPAERIAGQARLCTWCACYAYHGWFWDVAWDVGLAVLRPDGRSLGFLAATDMD